MPATASIIRGWLEKLYWHESQYTHLIIRCDRFDYHGDPRDSCCYPVYVKRGEDVREKVSKGGDRLMEVYSASHGLEEQMAQPRVFNYD